MEEADEEVVDELKATEARIAEGEQRLAALQARRGALQASLGRRRDELATLLRAAYAIGGDAPLELMLSQDSIAESNRLLAYHGYLQRDRARRVAALSTELDQVRQVEQGIAAARRELEAARGRQSAQLARLSRDRGDRATLVASLDRKLLISLTQRLRANESNH